MLGLMSVLDIDQLTLLTVWVFVASHKLFCVLATFSGWLLFRYQQAWGLNAKLLLDHPTYEQLMQVYNIVVSTINYTFSYPAWDYKKQNISKTQRSFNEAFIKIICTCFVLCSCAPSICCLKLPKTMFVGRKFWDPTLSCDPLQALTIILKHVIFAGRCFNVYCIPTGQKNYWWSHVLQGWYLSKKPRLFSANDVL